MFNLLNNSYSSDNVEEYYKKLFTSTIFQVFVAIGVITSLKFLLVYPLDIKGKIVIAIFTTLFIRATLFPLGLIDHIANMVKTITEVSNKNSDIGKNVTKIQLAKYWIIMLASMVMLVIGFHFTKAIIDT